MAEPKIRQFYVPNEKEKKLVLEVSAPSAKWGDIIEVLKKVHNKLGTKWKMGMSEPEEKDADVTSFIITKIPEKTQMGGAFSPKAFRKETRGTNVMGPVRYEFIIYLESQDTGIYGSIKKVLEEVQGVRCEFTRAEID